MPAQWQCAGRNEISKLVGCFGDLGPGQLLEVAVCLP